MNNLLHWLELFGVVVLAISGGFQASIKQLDIIGFLLVAAAAGIGGRCGISCSTTDQCSGSGSLCGFG
jgi:uncharacterized membrane protein YeiH